MNLMLTAKCNNVDEFKKNGYRTGLFGKWHLGDAKEFLPTRHGFDEER